MYTYQNTFAKRTLRKTMIRTRLRMKAGATMAIPFRPAAPVILVRGTSSYSSSDGNDMSMEEQRTAPEQGSSLSSTHAPFLTS